MKLFDTNEPTDCTYLTLDRGKMEQKRKLAKITHHGKKYSINLERLAKISQETPTLFGVKWKKPH